MAYNLKFSALAVNTAVDAMCALLDGGTLKIYTGTQPLTPETATEETLLATATFGSPAFAAAEDGVATANTITPDSSIDADGTAAWFRAETSEGDAIIDGSVGVGVYDLVMSTVTFVLYAEFAVASLTLTLPQSA
jgi:hypothetical protein